MKFNIKQVLFTVFIVFVLVAAGYALHYAVSPLSTVEVRKETAENSIKEQDAYIIREESLFISDSDGTVYHNAFDGNRVARNSVVSTVFFGEIGTDKLKELGTIDKKIRLQSKKNSAYVYSVAEADVENTVNSILLDIPSMKEKNDVGAVAAAREDLNGIRSGSEKSQEDKINALKEEKQQIYADISTDYVEIASDISGVFTTYIDGAEGMLVPEEIESYTIGYLQSLPKYTAKNIKKTKINAGEPICKVMNNLEWYVSVCVPSESIAEHKVGESVKVRFDSIAGDMADGTVFHIGEDEGGRTLVTVKCSTYLESAFSYRYATVDLVFNSYSGYRVPISAIRTDEDGSKYVLAMSGTHEYKCVCDILYTDLETGFSIVESTEDAQNKIKSMERIVTGER